jgi:DNA-binding response OmpR family regulator
MSDSFIAPPVNEGGMPVVHLTPTEGRLLGVLRAEPGRIFSRAELLALVMPGSVITGRTIDVHVRALRKKLGADAKIHTVRKQGYCWLDREP